MNLFQLLVCPLPTGNIRWFSWPCFVWTWIKLKKHFTDFLSHPPDSICCWASPSFHISSYGNAARTTISQGQGKGGKGEWMIQWFDLFSFLLSLHFNPNPSLFSPPSWGPPPPAPSSFLSCVGRGNRLGKGRGRGLGLSLSLSKWCQSHQYALESG